MLAGARAKGAIVGGAGVVVFTVGIASVALATLAVITNGAGDTVVADTAEGRVGAATLEVAGIRSAGIAVVARVIDRPDALAVLALRVPVIGTGVAVVAGTAVHVRFEGAHALARRALVRGAVVVVVTDLLATFPGRIALKATALDLVTRLPADRPGRALGIVYLVGATQLFVACIRGAVDAVVANHRLVDALAAQAGVDGAGVEIFAQCVEQLARITFHDGRNGQLTTADAEETNVAAGAGIAVVARRRVVGVGATLGHVTDIVGAGILVVAIVLATLRRRGDVLTDVLGVVAHVHRRGVLTSVLTAVGARVRGDSGILIVQVLLRTHVRRHVSGVGGFEVIASAGRQCDQHREDRGFRTVRVEHDARPPKP